MLILILKKCFFEFLEKKKVGQKKNFFVSFPKFSCKRLSSKKIVKIQENNILVGFGVPLNNGGMQKKLFVKETSERI